MFSLAFCRLLFRPFSPICINFQIGTNDGRKVCNQIRTKIIVNFIHFIGFVDFMFFFSYEMESGCRSTVHNINLNIYTFMHHSHRNRWRLRKQNTLIKIPWINHTHTHTYHKCIIGRSTRNVSLPKTVESVFCVVCRMVRIHSKAKKKTDEAHHFLYIFYTFSSNFSLHCNSSDGLSFVRDISILLSTYCKSNI